MDLTEGFLTAVASPRKPVIWTALDSKPFDFLSRSWAVGVLGPSSANTTATPSAGAVLLAKDKAV